MIGGAILERWKMCGGPGFGFPTSDEQVTADGMGRITHFRAMHLDGTPDASIVFHSDHGAHEIFGAIRDKWLASSDVKSQMRYPREREEVTVPFEEDGKAKGALQKFAGGYLVWHPHTGNEPKTVYGEILDRWLRIGGTYYGYPTTDETPCPDGRGRFNFFRDIRHESNVAIYWTPQFHAVEVYGAFLDYWAQRGFEQTSGLGYPMSPEQDDGHGGRVQQFEHHSLLWRDGTVSVLN
jgi:uncharacterized protein with LGFP repeats